MPQLRRKSKNPAKKIIEEADRLLQDTYRKKYPNKKCEACPAKFQLMHHWFPKSMSARLRYDHKNLIFLCRACHFAHHQKGDPTIHGKVIQKRGIKWYNELYELKRESAKTLDEAIKYIKLCSHTT